MKNQIRVLKKEVRILTERITKLERIITKQNKVSFLYLFKCKYAVHKERHFENAGHSPGTSR